MSDAERFHIDQTDEIAPGWLRHWDWVLVLSISWLLFELYAQPVLSIATASLKFGLDDFLSGFWLWRKDPDRGRGRTCGVFYTAAGFWQITVTTLFMSIVGVACVVVIQTANGPQPLEGVKEAELNAGVSFTIVCLCFVASSVITWFAIVLAWWYQQKVWLDSSVRYSRRNSQWPPRANGSNRISRVVTSSLIFLVVSATVTSLVFMVAAVGQRANPPLLVALSPFICLCVTALVSVALGRWLIGSLAADSARECWTDDEVEVLDDYELYAAEG